MLTIWTYDWVPNGPRGYVRDVRLRWACEEAELVYEVRSVSFEKRGPEHLARQPFGQVPFLVDDGLTIFESGACLLHLGRKCDTLMPRDPAGEAEVIEWAIAALNSIEMVSVPLFFLGASSEGGRKLSGWLAKRLAQLEAVLARREWIAAGRFTVADIVMADVLRQPQVGELAGAYPALAAYVDRLCARPAFRKAQADQLAHFAAADETRSQTEQ